MDAAQVVDAEKVIREQLLALLNGGNAHMPFDMIVAEMPIKAANTRPPHYSYTPWHLLEHMRRAQYDILEFMRNPDYESPPYEEFWPDEEETADESQWQESVALFKADLEAVMDLVRKPDMVFGTSIPHAPDYTFIREFLLVADHNAYHLGEMASLRQVLRVPPPERW
jgi:hypothetical protein